MNRRCFMGYALLPVMVLMLLAFYACLTWGHR